MPDEITEWHTAHFISDLVSPVESDFGVIVLNQPIELETRIFQQIWRRAKLRVCADGGANRLHDFNQANGENYLPDMVVGDFDSLKQSVRKVFEKQGVQFYHSDDLYSTDFDKAIDEIKRFESEHNIPPLAMAALGGLGGRVDQAFSLVNQMYKTLPRKIFLLSEMNISFLLHAGYNRIHAPPEVYGPCCGIIPMSGPTMYTLKGFRWNLQNFVTEFGGMVSTSNEIDGDHAIVITDKPVLWTIEFRV